MSQIEIGPRFRFGRRPYSRAIDFINKRHFRFDVLWSFIADEARSVRIVRAIHKDEANARKILCRHHRIASLPQARKAGIGAAVCSVFILAIVFLAMHTLPFSNG